MSHNDGIVKVKYYNLSTYIRLDLFLSSSCKVLNDLRS